MQKLMCYNLIPYTRLEMRLNTHLFTKEETNPLYILNNLLNKQN